MNTKKKLQAFFDETHDKAQYIQAYEENKAYFDELLRTGRWEEIDFVLPIKLWKYADSLGQSGQYSKALKVLSEVERDLPKLKGRSRWHAMYEESLTFLKAVNLARLKRYKESNELLKELLTAKRPNENYANWYRSNQKALVDRFLQPVMIVSMLGYLVILGLDWLDLVRVSIWMRTIAFAVSISAFVGSWIYGKWIDRSIPQF
jgi:tetratricopeptide (TPR) repeat protein